MHSYIVKYQDDRYNMGNICMQVHQPSNAKTIGDMKGVLETNGLYNDNVDILMVEANEHRGQFISYPNDYELRHLYGEKHPPYTKSLYIMKRSNPVDNKQPSRLFDVFDRKCRELCEEMSALKASNESEVKALKAQLKSAMDSMQTSEDSIKTWIEGNNDLKQKLLTCISSFRKEITDLKQKLCEISTKNSELSEELSALKASKHIIESDVKLLAQDINALNISCSASVQQDMSSMSSSIGSHNQLTTNSDKTGDENNIQEMFIEIGNQIKDQNKITNNLLKALVIEKEITLTALKDIRQSVEDSDDSKSMASVDSHPK